MILLIQSQQIVKGYLFFVADKNLDRKQKASLFARKACHPLKLWI